MLKLVKNLKSKQGQIRGTVMKFMLLTTLWMDSVLTLENMVHLGKQRPSFMNLNSLPCLQSCLSADTSERFNPLS